MLEYKPICRLILGPRRRRALPEIAALYNLGILRYGREKKQNGHIIQAKQLQCSVQMAHCYERGLVPVNRHGWPDEVPIIRMAAVAGMGMVEAMEVYKRCCVPRQYEPWRAYPCMGREVHPRVFASGSQPGYKDAANHFIREMMGNDKPGWHWRQFEAEMIRQCERRGISLEESGVILDPTVGALLRCYWGEGNLPELEEQAADAHGWGDAFMQSTPPNDEPACWMWDDPETRFGEDGD